MSTVYGLSGDIEKCIKITRDLVSIAETNFGRRTPVTQVQIFGLAISLKEAGEHEEAIQLLNEFIAAADAGVELPKAKIRQAQRELWLSTVLMTASGIMKKNDPPIEVPNVKSIDKLE